MVEPCAGCGHLLRRVCHVSSLNKTMFRRKQTKGSSEAYEFHTTSDMYVGLCVCSEFQRIFYHGSPGDMV